MKLKNLFAAALLLCSGTAMAQTDVTSTYLTNPSFELSAEETTTSAQALTSGGSYYGWTLPALGTSFVNISIGSSSACNGNAFGIPTATEGSYYYFARRGWNSSTSSDATLSTTMSSLPTGQYVLTMDYKGLDSWDDSHKSNGSYFKIEAVESSSTLNSVQTSAFDAVKGNSAGANKFKEAANWKSVSLTFNVTTVGDVTLNIVHHMVGGVRTDVVVDNLKLTWTDPDAAANAAKLETAKYTLNGYIKKATALNSVLADETLATDITTAQGVYDAATDYATHYEGVGTASTTLSAAITTALSGATQKELTNGNFDDTPNNTLGDGGATVYGGTLSTSTSNPDNTKDMSANTGDHGYLYEVTSWTQYSKFNSTASQGTTSEYGTAMPANGWSTNSTTIPSTDMFGATDGAALHLSSGWSDQARYTQTIENLPSGRYIFYYEANNQNSSATSINSNYFGVSGTAGDFYGTTNSFVYSDAKTFAYDTWTANAFEFDVAKTANITFNVGLIGTTGGSASAAKLWIDNVLVYRIGDIMVSDEDANTIISNAGTAAAKTFNATEKTALSDALTAFEANKNLDNYNTLNSALVTANASISVYETLDAAITKVEGWTSDATTVTDPIRTKYTNGKYSDETTAANIYSEYQAAEITALVAASATDYTSVILNHSFENGDMTGWSAESRTDTGVKENSNATYSITSGDAVDGSYIFNSWGGTAENNVYQTIPSLPAGTYQLSALLAGFVGEELVLAAGETTNSVTVTGDKTVGYTVNVVFTLSEAANVVIKASNTKGAESSDASFIKVDNFVLKAYSDPLAALKEQLSSLKTQASTALSSTDYETVTGDEKTTLEGYVNAEAPEETEEAYNTAISNITAAITAFTEAKSNYDTFATAKTDAAAYTATVWPYASDDKKTALSTAVAATPSTAAEAATKAAAIVTAYRQFVESNGKAEGAEITTDYTSSVAGNDASASTSGWTGSIGTNQGQSYTDGDGNTTTKYFDGGWSASAGANVSLTQEITLPEGDYLMQITARGSTALTAYTLSVGDVSVDLPKDGNTGGTFGNGWSDKYLTFSSDGTAKTITITATSEVAYQWISFNRIRLTKYGTAATTDDYAALNTAIEAAEGMALGFDVDEYAPYNNVAVLEALATAKAFDQTASNWQTDVQAVTTALTGATWTANTEEVNAIYDGTLANATIQATSENVVLPGWVTKSGNTRQTFSGTGEDGKACLADAEDGVGLFVHPGTYNYGETTGYTMPLDAGVKYVAEAKYCAWADDSNKDFTLTILKGSETIATKSYGANATACTTEGALKHVKLFFDVAEAGDYVLSVVVNGNTFMTDFIIKKAVAEDVTISEEDSYTPEETYANVTLTRTIKADTWNSFVVPFAISNDDLKAAFGNDVAVAEYSDEGESADAVTVNFNKMETPAITANVPVLLKTSTAGTSYTFNGVMTAEGTPTKTGTYFDFVGTYAASMTVEAGDYFIGSNKLYKSTGATTLKGTRAYLQDKTEAGVKALTLVIDGLTTGIATIENGELNIEEGAIYNVAGQRLNKLQKGLNIVNGKKVLVK